MGVIATPAYQAVSILVNFEAALAEDAPATEQEGVVVSYLGAVCAGEDGARCA